MVRLTRILIMARKASSEKFSPVTLTTESLRCQAVLKHSGAELDPYFSNRVAEIKHNIDEVRKKAGQVKNFTHIESKLNPADIGKRMGVRLDGLVPSSIWQKGSDFLLLPREKWPVSALVEGETSKEELRKHCLDAWKDTRAAHRRQDQMEGLAAAVLGGTPGDTSRAAGTDAPGGVLLERGQSVREARALST